MSAPAPGLAFPVVEPIAKGLGRVVWGVDALVLAVTDLLAARFGACAVRGEISGWSRAASGHCYFNLKDAEGGSALLRCAMFRRAASLLDFTPADGQRIELRGRLGVYEARGELQLIVEAMQRAGVGSLYEEFLRRKARLGAEGLFDSTRKRSLVAYPRCVGVVTSLGAAALHDVISALQRRAAHVRVVVYPSLVQGADAPAALCHALASAALHGAADTLLVCRGGGSLEDLMAFNDERVVRAIAASPMPVVCGVGHESDVTLADLAADLRAPTPTAAAELAAPRTQDCIDALDTFGELMRRRLRAALDSRAQALDHAAMRLSRPADSVRQSAQRLETLSQQLAAAARRSVEARRWQWTLSAERLARAIAAVPQAHANRLDAITSRLQALDPKRVLARGYVWLADEQGQAVVSVTRLSVGANLNAVLVDGSAQVSVTALRHNPPEP